MERCQETSQAPPIEEEVTASTPHQMYQGTLVVFEVTCAVVWLPAYGVGKVEEAMRPRSLWAQSYTLLRLNCLFCSRVCVLHGWQARDRTNLRMKMVEHLSML